MLEVKNLKAGYDGIPVVHNVSFKAEEGRIIGLIGSNGSGKTSSLKAITGLIKPMEGQISYNGQVLNNLSPHKVVSMGLCMVPEGRHLFGKMSVKDNLLLGAYLINDTEKKQKLLDDIFTIFPRIKERLKQSAETLSGGEQQMVAIARGLMSSPKLLILDEPSLGLAPKLVTEVFAFIKEINKIGITLILVEQNVNETLALADYVYVIQNGETVLEGTSESMSADESIKKAYLGL